MKKLNYFSKITFLLIFCFFSNQTFAQGDVSELIKSGPEDAAKLAKAYLNPFFKGLGFGMNSGWYNSAKAKNLGKFDLRIQASAAMVPSSDQSFDIRTLGLSNKTRLRNPANFSTPTAFGANNEGPELVLYDNNGTEVGSFNMPAGSGIKFVPSPQVQATIGIIKNTDVSIRYSPEIGKSEDYGTVQVLGFGIKHEITKLLMPGKTEKIIPIDIAIAAGYNQIKYNYQVAQADQVDDSNSGQDLKQRVEGKFSGYTFDAIVSKKIALFTPFFSIGYNTAKTDLGLLGNYIVRTSAPTVISPLPNSPDKFTTFTDPVKFKQDDIAGVRSSIGFSLHLAIFRLYGAYSIGEYQAYTAGIGLGIGK
ncbi:DUF6588 family protein [Pedobacter cryophilus]|uniref:DUF5723 domain-containing protein n=1 Tax=Pedobacter cryophilus TaxID=2571271 RepID=A0A4V5NWX7_9SPHI|nr:DUF6588 family protein [Pedobacter cryophilus]TKB96810.1 hypothetical protein FA046_12050 [Pedobacter cryophilus]